MIDERDEQFLRRAFSVARRSQEKGNYPFGAILVSEGGEVLLEAENTVISETDCAGHAELNLMREAVRRIDPVVLSGSAVYASAEPCAMCSGALFWGGIKRLVYGLSKARASEVEREKQAGPQLLLKCRAVLAAGERPIEVVGPVLEDEAESVLRGVQVKLKTALVSISG
jgi:tRNA(Arg) A34 adenosine deaminase TadA